MSVDSVFRGLPLVFNVTNTSILLLGRLGLLGLRLAAHDAGHLDLLVLAHLTGLGAAQLEVLGDLLDDGLLLADLLGLLLALHVVRVVRVGLGLSLVQISVMVRQSWGRSELNVSVTTFLPCLHTSISLHSPSS